MERDPLIWKRAREALPLPNLMTKMGDGQFAARNSPCPFCNEKKGWSVYRETSSNAFFFKCHGPGCPANQAEHGHNEIGYIILRRGLPANEASQLFLSLALPGEYQQPPPDKPASPQPERRDFSAREGPARNVWHNLWKRLCLNPGDREKLFLKRGLSPEVIDALGFRSNNPSNIGCMTALAEDVGVDNLVQEGLFIDDRRSLRPSGQFLGYGITGSKKDGHPQFELTEPPIIPYLDENGVPFYLRPHKGGVKRPGDEFEVERLILETAGEDAPCAAHVYCPFTIADLIASFDGRCILTEGEFKVAALYQCGIPAIAVPGIQFIRNPAFKKQLLAILSSCGVTEVIVIFDNEVKDDSNLPSYKPDPLKRFDTQVWAEYTAIDLRKSINASVKIGWIPDEMRIDGKADFDGVLAGFVHGVKDHKVFETPLGLKVGTTRARLLFRDIMESATEKTSQQDLFPSEVQRIIGSLLSQLFYPPKLHSGGDKEARLARKFSEPSEFTNLPIDEDMGNLLREVRGCYYERKNLDKEAREAFRKELSVLDEALQKHKDNEHPLANKHLAHIYTRQAAIYEWLRGAPTPVSNFTVKCLFKLHAGDTVHRLVTIKNRNDSLKSETIFRLPPKSLARSTEFKEWMLSTGRGVWSGGDKKLEALAEDLDMRSHMRDIHEVNLYGWHQESKIWFFGDCAFVTVGDQVKRIEADKTNIFWHEGIGYQVDASIDTRGSSFAQKAPLMLATEACAKDQPTLPALLNSICHDFFESMGGFEGWLALSMMFAYGISPELLKDGGHPGAWLYGKTGGGKTTVAKWLMRIWGFNDLTGLSLCESTAVAINRMLAQYSCLPTWFDEFRKDQVDMQKVYVLRHAFDRGGAGKGLPDYSVRTRMAGAKTTPLVSGETGSTDAATRSRYAQIQVSTYNRIGDPPTQAKRLAKMHRESNHYYLLGRAIMEQRPAFLAAFESYRVVWNTSPLTSDKIKDPRAQLVYGIAYAAMNAMDEILGAKLQRFGDYTRFLHEHGAASLADTMDETFANTFFKDVIGGLQTNEIKRKNFLIDHVIRNPDDNSLRSVDGDDTDAITVLYIAAPPAYNEYASDKRSRGEQPQLDLNGLGRELSKEPYWLPAPKNNQRVHRKTIAGIRRAVWAITLERRSHEPGSPHLFPFAGDFIQLVAADQAELDALAARGIISDEDLAPN